MVQELNRRSDKMISFVGFYGQLLTDGSFAGSLAFLAMTTQDRCQPVFITMYVLLSQLEPKEAMQQHRKESTMTEADNIKSILQYGGAHTQLFYFISFMHTLTFIQNRILRMR